jgi:hypothetical protein
MRGGGGGQISPTHLPIDLALVNLPKSTFSNEIDLVEVPGRGEQVLEGEAVRVPVGDIRRNLPPRVGPCPQQKSQAKFKTRKGESSTRRRGRKTIENLMHRPTGCRWPWNA